MPEIREVKTNRTTVETGETIHITFDIWYEEDYPYDYPHDYPITTERK